MHSPLRLKKNNNLVQILKKRIPEIDNVAEMLGFFSTEELIEEALKESNIRSLEEAEQQVLRYILTSMGYDYIETISEMKEKLRATLAMLEKISLTIVKHRKSEEL